MFWGWLIKYLNSSSVGTRVHCFYYKSWMWIFFFIGVFLFSGSLTLQGSGNSTNLVYKAVSYIRVTLCSQHLKQSPKVLFDGCTHQRKLFFCSVPPAHSITELQSSEAPEARQLYAKVNVVPRLNGDNQLSLMLIISKSFHLLYQPCKNEENILDLSRTRFWQPADTRWYQQPAPAQEELICSLLAPWISRADQGLVPAHENAPQPCMKLTWSLAAEMPMQNLHGWHFSLQSWDLLNRVAHAEAALKPQYDSMFLMQLHPQWLCGCFLLYKALPVLQWPTFMLWLEKVEKKKKKIKQTKPSNPSTTKKQVTTF